MKSKTNKQTNQIGEHTRNRQHTKQKTNWKIKQTNKNK